MAKKFTLQASLVQDLLSFMHSLKPDDIGQAKPGEELKAAKFGYSLMDEIEKSIPEISALVDKANAKLDPMKKEELVALTKLSEDTASLPEAEREAKRNAATEAANKRINEAQEAITKKMGLEEKRAAIVTVNIGSDERYIFLQDLFKKYATKRFNLLKPMVDIANAIDTAVEA